VQSVRSSNPLSLSACWLLGIASTLLGAAGQLLFRAFSQAQTLSPVNGLWESLGKSETPWTVPTGFGYLLVGIGCYLVAVLLWVRVLRDLPLSRAYPLLSLSYPLVYCGAVVWLGESLSLQRTVGTALVSLGALLAVAPNTAAQAASE